MMFEYIYFTIENSTLISIYVIAKMQCRCLNIDYALLGELSVRFIHTDGITAVIGRSESVTNIWVNVTRAEHDSF